VRTVRARFPQIYGSADRLKVDVTQLRVRACHFESALRDIAPAAGRSAAGAEAPRALDRETTARLLAADVDAATAAVARVFPAATLGSGSRGSGGGGNATNTTDGNQASAGGGGNVDTGASSVFGGGVGVGGGSGGSSSGGSSVGVRDDPAAAPMRPADGVDLDRDMQEDVTACWKPIAKRRGGTGGFSGLPSLSVEAAMEMLRPLAPPTSSGARVLLTGPPGGGQEAVASATLHRIAERSNMAVRVVSSVTLHSKGSMGLSPEEALLNIFNETLRSTPSILYIPRADALWASAGPGLRAVLAGGLFGPCDLDHAAVLIVGTAAGDRGAWWGVFFLFVC
jgi:hypothetical protein